MDSFPTRDDLSRLREALRELRRHEGGPVPHQAIVAFGASLGGDAPVTLDLEASEVVGVPILVVGPARSPALAGLSPREQEVVDALAEGLTNKAIALRLGLSSATVKDHVHHILQKTGLPSRAAVVARLPRPPL